MGGWITLIIITVPSYLFWQNGYITLLAVSTTNLVINFWSFGVMHNFYYQASQITKQRNANLRHNIRLEGRLDQEMEIMLGKLEDGADYRTLEFVPDWITRVNMITAITGLCLLIASIIL